MPKSGNILSVAARSSPLSRAQVEEVLRELKLHVLSVVFEPFYVKTRGDRDQKTSLRELDKTDFFTKEVDALVLLGRCRAAIHSAKDLPDPMHPKLKVVALTRSIDPTDVIVLREEDALKRLPQGALIASSSLQREQRVLRLLPHVRVVDIRGTIGKRLKALFEKRVDGVVVAKAALIRLGLTHLNMHLLPGPTTPLQGSLAVVAQKGDEEMERLFSAIDVR